MEIGDIIQNYKSHPVLFVGAGISKRYLMNSFRWEELLEKIAKAVNPDERYYLDKKNESKCKQDNSFNLPKLASLLEKDIDEQCKTFTKGLWDEVNRTFYEEMKSGLSSSRLKIYISLLLKDLNYRDEYKEELRLFRSIRKNIASVITTNYDMLIEDVFKFTPLIGNDILLSNPYGSVYKIHGSIDKPSEIVITAEDYEKFNSKYELIKAQLLSLFIHNPIIFLGYSINDENIRKILETIFSYVDANSRLANEIRKNFLLMVNCKIYCDK